VLFLSFGCGNRQGLNSNPDDPTDLGEKHGKQANVMGLDVQYLEHQVLEPEHANSRSKQVAVQYSIKNTTSNVLSRSAERIW
jgi:hypothetical protein